MVEFNSKGHSDTISLMWLLRLRWCAFAAQALIVVLTPWLLGLSVPSLPLFCIIALGVASNPLAFFIGKRISTLRPILGAVLVLDIGILTGLLFFSGGPTNPFSIVYLVHVTLATLLLGQRWTWGIAAFCSLCFGLLFPFHIPIAGMHSHHQSGEEGALSLHLYGMWCAFMVVAALSAYFLTKISAALKKRDEELHDLRLMALHQEKLVALTTLAAGAAHELATPLSTIAVAAGELHSQIKHSPEFAELCPDIALIQSELVRCRKILDQMNPRTGQPAGELPSEKSLEEIAQALKEELRPAHKARFQIKIVSPQLRVRLPIQALHQSVSALIKNAFDASSGDVQLVLQSADQGIQVTVQDFGPGVPAPILARLGEPFFTTKEPGQGMGLGLFIARLFAERLGGHLRIDSTPGTGTAVSLFLPVNCI